jgi:hypothetical protein
MTLILFISACLLIYGIVELKDALTGEQQY